MTTETSLRITTFSQFKEDQRSVIMEKADLIGQCSTGARAILYLATLEKLILDMDDEIFINQINALLCLKVDHYLFVEDHKC